MLICQPVFRLCVVLFCLCIAVISFPR